MENAKSKSSCGGVIIDEYHIITAAHCVRNIDERNIRVLPGIGRSSKFGLFGIRKKYVHPKYQEQGGMGFVKAVAKAIGAQAWRNMGKINDIAVLTTTNPLPDTIKKAALPTNRDLPYGQLLDFAGWGGSESKADQIPRFTKLSIVPNEVAYKQKIPTMKNEFMAFDPTKQSYAENGDSGGPLIAGNTVYGILSKSVASPGRPILFSKVWDHMEFIKGCLKDVKGS